MKWKTFRQYIGVFTYLVGLAKEQFVKLILRHNLKTIINCL